MNRMFYNRLRGPLWDSAKIAGGDRVHLFTVPRGQGTSIFASNLQVPKQAADTNMVLSGCLPSAWHFNVECLSCDPVLGTPRGLLEAVTLEVIINEGIYTHLPASRATCRLTEEEVAAGWLMPGMAWGHELGDASLMLAEGVSFSVLAANAGTATVSLRVMLDGMLSIPVP